MMTGSVAKTIARTTMSRTAGLLLGLLPGLLLPVLFSDGAGKDLFEAVHVRRPAVGERQPAARVLRQAGPRLSIAEQARETVLQPLVARRGEEVAAMPEAALGEAREHPVRAD